MATIPHESFRLKLESMIQTGQLIAERLSKSKISAGKVGLAGAIGKELFPDHRGLIGAAQRLLKVQGSYEEASLATETSKWLMEIGSSISGVPTGRRRGEITAGTKRKWLKDLAMNCKAKTMGALVLRVNSTLSRIHLEVAKLEAVWRPRGKMLVGGRILEGRDEIAGILRSVDNGPLIVCDPYVSTDTLVSLESSRASTEIVILTVNIDHKSKFDDYVRKLREQGRQLKIGIIDKAGGVTTA